MKRILACLSLFVLVAICPAPSLCKEQGVNYDNEDLFVVLIGRISKYKQVGFNEDGEVPIYNAKVNVDRVISGRRFDLKSFNTLIDVYDIDYTMMRNMIIVLRKESPWRVVFWKSTIDVICLNKDMIEGDGWLSLSGDRISDNCIGL